MPVLVLQSNRGVQYSGRYMSPPHKILIDTHTSHLRIRVPQPLASLGLVWFSVHEEWRLGPPLSHLWYSAAVWRLY